MTSCKIITYHYVRPIKKSKFPFIKGLEFDTFVRQIEYLKNNFNFITSQDLIDCLYDNKKIPNNSILLTFDDGLKDHFTYVFPILKKYEIQGLFFPSAKPIEDKIVLDVHKIHFILANLQDVKFTIDEIFSFMDANKEKYNLESNESYFSKLAIANNLDTKETVFIKRILQRSLPITLRTEIVDHLFRKYVTSDEQLFSTDLYLSFDEINEMKQSGMYFGSHGYSHQWLSYMTSNDLKLEIKQSLAFYKRICGNCTNLIMCYPHGDYNESVIMELKKEGFKAGLTIESGDNMLTKCDAFRLKRYDVVDFFHTKN